VSSKAGEVHFNGTDIEGVLKDVTTRTIGINMIFFSLGFLSDIPFGYYRIIGLLLGIEESI
jgi:hypothetical protein